MTLIQLTGAKVRKIQGDRQGVFPEAPADPREVKGSSPEHTMAKLRSDEQELARLRGQAKSMPDSGNSKTK